MNPRVWLTLFAVSVLAGFLVWGFFATFEPVQRRQRQSLSTAALRNPLLAAERTLRKLGVNAQVVLGHELPLEQLGRNDAVWFYRVRGPISAQARAKLLAWVKRGGHLIMDATHLRNTNSSSRAPDVVTQLKVSVLEIAEDERASGPVTLRFAGDDRDVQVAFSRRWELLDGEDTADAGVWGAQGAYLLQFDLGEGSLTVAVDHDFLSNDRIGDLDHAYYLYSLLGHADKVWLVHRTELPGLLQRLWSTTPAALVLTLVLSALVVWRGVLRVGPLLTRESTGQRDLVTSLVAQGEFLWRYAEVDDLLVHGRDAVKRIWYRCNPALRRMDPAGRCAWIAERSGLTKDQVHDALFAGQPSREEFTRLTVLLQRLIDAPTSLNAKGSP